VLLHHTQHTIYHVENELDLINGKRTLCQKNEVLICFPQFLSGRSLELRAPLMQCWLRWTESLGYVATCRSLALLLLFVVKERVTPSIIGSICTLPKEFLLRSVYLIVRTTEEDRVI
jgi:hypothetical protein